MCTRNLYIFLFLFDCKIVWKKPFLSVVSCISCKFIKYLFYILFFFKFEVLPWYFFSNHLSVRLSRSYYYNNFFCVISIYTVLFSHCITKFVFEKKSFSALLIFAWCGFFCFNAENNIFTVIIITICLIGEKREKQKQWRKIWKNKEKVQSFPEKKNIILTKT